MQETSVQPVAKKTTSFVVPYWIKVVFSWTAVALLLALIGFQVHKRALYRRLYFISVMRPLSLEPQTVPPFSLLKGKDGAPISLAAFGEKWVLLNFWATWCPPCREEMPSLELLHRDMSDKMVVLAVSVDENWADVQKFFVEMPPSMVVAWDQGQKTAQVFGVAKYPETFLISPDRKIVAKFVGPRDWSSDEALRYFADIINSHQGG